VLMRSCAQTCNRVTDWLPRRANTTLTEFAKTHFWAPRNNSLQFEIKDCIIMSMLRTACHVDGLKEEKRQSRNTAAGAASKIAVGKLNGTVGAQPPRSSTTGGTARTFVLLQFDQNHCTPRDRHEGMCRGARRVRRRTRCHGWQTRVNVAESAIPRDFACGLRPDFQTLAREALKAIAEATGT
jgi:hypothetical protein